MRKYYVDNLRILCILLLFPFHASVIYNNWGEQWYINQPGQWLPSIFVTITYPWWMSLLFVIAGMSTVYALQHRTLQEYRRERVHKLLIPFISGLFLVIPVQSYIADIFYNGYEGNYFEHYKEFFVLTTWSGSDGHFTPGHTWFILYLYIACQVSLPLISKYRKREKEVKESSNREAQKKTGLIEGSKLTMPWLLALFVLLIITAPILDIGGKSMGEYTCCFLLGYFVMSLDAVQERVEKHWKDLTIAWIVFMVIHVVMNFIGINTQNWTVVSEGTYDLLLGVEYRIYEWIGILACLGLGKHFLNQKTKLTEVMAPAAFPLYYFHQSVMVVVGYFVISNCSIMPVQYFAIVIGTFVISWLLYELCSRFSVTCFLFGFKKK